MLIGGDLSRLTRRVRPVPALAPLLRREAADKGKEGQKLETKFDGSKPT